MVNGQYPTSPVHIGDKMANNTCANTVDKLVGVRSTSVNHDGTVPGTHGNGLLPDPTWGTPILNTPISTSRFDTKGRTTKCWNMLEHAEAFELIAEPGWTSNQILTRISHVHKLNRIQLAGGSKTSYSLVSSAAFSFWIRRISCQAVTKQQLMVTPKTLPELYGCRAPNDNQQEDTATTVFFETADVGL